MEVKRGRDEGGRRAGRTRRRKTSNSRRDPKTEKEQEMLSC